MHLIRTRSCGIRTANYGEIMRRRRRYETEMEKSPEQIAVDEFFELSDLVDRHRAAYAAAGQLDAEGNHSDADRVLREAGVEEREIQRRRQHIKAIPIAAGCG